MSDILYPQWEPAGESASSPDDAYFASPHWINAVAALGARCWTRRGDEGGRRLFVFARGPLRVGFPGFPVGWGGSTAALGKLPERVDLLRWNFSMLDAPPPDAATGRIVLLPESVIPSLGSWPVRNAKRLAKDMAFSRRQAVAVEPALEAHAAAIHEIYRATVSRHGGALRYNREYFVRLLGEGEGRTLLKASVATVGDAHALAGFCIAVADRGRGYYLHGGVDPSFRARGVSDLLLDGAIAWARDAGCRDFTLMASPADQPGLAGFKRKWSERDGAWTTVDVASSAVGRLVLGATRFVDAIKGPPGPPR